jgi:hypothetical protein
VATKIRNTGFINSAPSDLPRYAGSVSVIHPLNATLIHVLADVNNSATTVGYGERNNISKIYVYESDYARTTWTLRATITTSSAIAKPPLQAVEAFADGDIGIVYKLANGNTVYRKIDSTTWTASAEETVRASVAGTAAIALDMTITDGEVPVIGLLRSSTTAGQESTVEVYVRRTSDSTWQRPVQTVTFTGPVHATNRDISITAMKGLGSATSRPMAVISSQASTTLDGDAQLRSFVIREDTGAIVTAPVLRATLTPDSAQGIAPQSASARRVFVCDRQAGGDELHVGVVSDRIGVGGANVAPIVVVAQYKWNGTTWSEYIPPASYDGPIDWNADNGVAITGSFDAIRFWFGASRVISGSRQPASIHMVNGQYDDPTRSARWSTHVWTAQASTGTTEGIPMAASKRSHSLRQLEISYLLQKSAQAYELWHEPFKESLDPVMALPANGSTVTTSTPAVAVDADLDRYYPQSSHRVFWNFAKDAGFTTGNVYYNQPYSKSIDIIGTNQAGVVQRITDVLPISSLLPQGLWYGRALLSHEFGASSGYGPAVSFTVSHPPVPASLTPTADQYLFFGTTGNVTFKWAFTDSSPEDYQTAYQIIVERVSDGATLSDTGKVVSTPLRQHTLAILAANKDVQLRWKIRLWDRDDVAGAYSAYQTFYIVDPPTLAVTSPTVDQVLTTGLPPVTFNVTIGASRTLKSYRVNFWQGGNVVHSSGLVNVPGSLTGVVPITYTPPTPILRNNQLYTVEVIATDSFNIDTNTVQVPVSTLWALPASVTGVTLDITQYNVEGNGYVLVSWADTGRDADFEYWSIYRRNNETDPATGVVVEVGDWVLVGLSYDLNPVTHSYKDYNCPSGGKVEYKVTQTVNRFGDLVEGADSNIPFANPVTEGYWLIATDESDAFYLSIVTGDSYTDEYEEDEYVIVGRGRHVDRGEHLGLSGSLSVQLRNTGGTTARQKKRRLENMKENNRVLFLRTPFGDVYRVSASNLGVGRIAGVGRNEFVDVEIPYKEVGA